MAGTVYRGGGGAGAWSADCYAGLGSFGVSGSVAAARHLSYAHRLKIVDNRKKNRTNCSNKQQTKTTATTRTTRGSWQLLFGLWWENNNRRLETEREREREGQRGKEGSDTNWLLEACPHEVRARDTTRHYKVIKRQHTQKTTTTTTATQTGCKRCRDRAIATRGGR